MLLLLLSALPLTMLHTIKTFFAMVAFKLISHALYMKSMTLCTSQCQLSFILDTVIIMFWQKNNYYAAMLHLVIVPAKQSVFVKAHSHCTHLRPEVPINKGCHLRNIKSWNHFNFYDTSMVYIGLPVITRCSTSAVWIGFYSLKTFIVLVLIIVIFKLL